MNSGFRNEVAVAGKKRTGGVRGAPSAIATFSDVSRVCDNRGNTDKTIGRKAVITENGIGAEIGIEGIVFFGCISVAATQCKPPAHALFERENPTIVGAAIPRSKTIHRRDAATAVVETRLKGKISLSHTQDVDDVLMVVVERDHQFIAELSLNPETVTARMRSSKTRVDSYWKIAGLGHIKRERAEWTPVPEIGWHTRGRVCSGKKSVRTQTRELLDVALVDRDIGRDRHRANLVQVIDSQVGSAWRREGVRARLTGNLRIGLRGREAQSKEVWSEGWDTVEETRERKWLTFKNVRTAEAGNIPNQAQAEMIVEDAEAAAHNSFWTGQPGEADTWRDVVRLIEGRIVVPPHTAINGQTGENLPIVLNP